MPVPVRTRDRFRTRPRPNLSAVAPVTCRQRARRQDRHGKPERHGTHGTGHRRRGEIGTDASPSGERERKGGRLPLRSWQTVRRRDRNGAPCPHLSADRHGKPSPVRRTVAADRPRRCNGKPSGEIATGRTVRQVARTCPAHHVRRDRAQVKPERHRANGRGDRNAAADRDGREPSGRSERHGGRLPLRSWQTVRRDRHRRRG